MNLLSIRWDVEPEIFHIGPIHPQWYGLLWACGIILAWWITKKIFKHEGHPADWTDKLGMYIIIGAIVGARLGHCIFYDGAYFLANPLEIILPFRDGEFLGYAGLASHGGAIGILIAAWLYNKKVSKKGFLWLMDRLVIGAAVCGACIRFGNLINSEIYGSATSLPWGFIFVRKGETEPMHPTQIYEMIYCLVTFAIIWWMYWKKDAEKKQGLIYGVFLIGIFGTRFLLEFIKLNQEAFEEGMLLNMGQILSIPFIIWGIWLIFRKHKAVRKK